jgi:divinyl protochlorophyllide a 8-vinyl-reductase
MRMPDGSMPVHAGSGARIGPNAILQLAGPLERMFDGAVMAQLLNLAQVPMPSGSEMVPEEDVQRVHHTLWQLFPDQARELSEEAGRGTARYITENRIPRFAQLVLRLMPRAIGERMLARAIAQHAWTFCGSGALDVQRRGREIHFVLENNPLAATGGPSHRSCHWHDAVFAELFSCVLGGRYSCEEASCRGCGGATCRFVLRRGSRHSHFKGLEV